MGNMLDELDDDSMFDFEEEGFDDEDNAVTIGVKQPDQTLMSLFDDTKAVHLVSIFPDDKRRPYTVLMEILEHLEGNTEVHDAFGINIVTGDR